ncbi:MAG: fimbrillin family protein [Candidatus Cryptobacteroides sp.]
MRSRLIYSILCNCIPAFVAGSLLASCTKLVPDDSFARQSDLIGFNTAMTKAAVGYPTSSRFISTAYSISSSLSWDNATARAGATTLIDQEEVSYVSESNSWRTVAAHYWDANYKFTFFSYSPSSLSATKVSVSTDGVAISNWDVEADATEILVADIAQDKTKNESYGSVTVYTGVPTNFRQKLSKLSFNMGISRDAEAGTKVTLLDIQIADICTKGDYSRGGYTNDSWAVREASRKTGTSVFSVFSGSQELSTETYFVPESKLIIPQSLLETASYHPTLIVKYQIQVGEGAVETKTADCHFDINLRQEAWEKGKEYTYTIHIGVGQYPIEFDGAVNDWSAGSDNEINIG